MGNACNFHIFYPAKKEFRNAGTSLDARFVDYLVREFVLRLRLPNDGETEKGIVKGLKELVGMP